LDKWEKGRGFWAKSPSSSSLPHDTERRRQGGRPWKGGGAPGSWCMATAGKWGETKRRSRATNSAPYLGLGCSGEADRRWRAATVMVVGGGGAWALGRQGGLVGVVCGEVGSRSGPFIGAGRSVRRGYFELRGAPMAGNGGSRKIPVWTPASGILGRLAAV
jgi:hypothetical protein